MSDPRTYHTVCLDIINRWVYPIIPEYQFGGKASSSLSLKTNYVQQKYNIYKDRSLKLPRCTRLGNSVVIGKDCVFGECVSIAKSIVSNGCVIGSNCSITNSHIWSSKLLICL